MSKTIGIFQGKQTKLNKTILTILYDNGPLTAWQITGKIRSTRKVSLHATINKRIRALEKKGYVSKNEKIWYMTFKGILANLIIQKNPKPWSDKWTNICGNVSRSLEAQKSFNTNDNPLNNNPHAGHLNEEIGNMPTAALNEFGKIGSEEIKVGYESLKTFSEWVKLSNLVKKLVELGVINFDVISNSTLVKFIDSQLSDDPFFGLLDKGKIGDKEGEVL